MQTTPRADRKQLRVYLAAIAIFGVMGGLYDTTFNNYLKHSFGISDQARSNLELPREMPGFLVTLVAGSLAGLALNRVGGVSMALASAGLAGLAFAHGNLATMIGFLVVFSTGVHLNIPTGSSITLALAREGKKATLLGKAGAAGILGTVAGAVFVAFVMKPLGFAFRGVYIIGALCAIAAAALVFSVGRVEGHSEKRRKVFVFKRRYTRYYVLSALYGARKQVFMTFGPWVLVKVFKQPEQTMAKLSIAYCVVGLVVQPAVGRLIDRLGERTMLVAEGLVLMCVCVTYAVAGAWPASGAALSAIMTVYVVDQLCFSVSMARTTYLAKIVESPEDLSGGLASGVSIDHLASMSLPMLGGLVWEAFGFRYVFWGASAIAVAMAAVSFGIRTPERTGPGAAAAAGKAAE